MVAVGEFGLDYDRTQFCSPETQRKYFLLQLDLAAATQLPLFLHCRAAAKDLVEILAANKDKVKPMGLKTLKSGCLRAQLVHLLAVDFW